MDEDRGFRIIEPEKDENMNITEEITENEESHKIPEDIYIYRSSEQVKKPKKKQDRKSVV